MEVVQEYPISWNLSDMKTGFIFGQPCLFPKSCFNHNTKGQLYVHMYTSISCMNVRKAVNDQGVFWQNSSRDCSHLTFIGKLHLRIVSYYM